MSDTHASHASTEKPFTDAEIRYFQQQDMSAGRAVVVLMCGIFSIGIVIYTIVTLAVTNTL